MKQYIIKGGCYNEILMETLQILSWLEAGLKSLEDINFRAERYFTTDTGEEVLRVEGLKEIEVGLKRLIENLRIQRKELGL